MTMTTEQLETLRNAASQMVGRAGELLRMSLDHADRLQDKLAAAYASNQHSFDAGEARARKWYESKLEHVQAEIDSLRRQLEQASQRGAPEGWRRGGLVTINQDEYPAPVPPAQPDTFCSDCGGNDETPQDHCMDCERGPATNDQIRRIFMDHGFTIKNGCEDLKPYIYAAARALIDEVLAQQADDDPLTCDYCGAETENPWHGSGMLNGNESRHIHACDNCRDLLPAAQPADTVPVPCDLLAALRAFAVQHDSGEAGCLRGHIDRLHRLLEGGDA